MELRVISTWPQVYLKPKFVDQTVLGEEGGTSRFEVRFPNVS